MVGLKKFLRAKKGMAVQICPHADVTVRNYENQVIREVFPEIRGEFKRLGFKDLGEVGQIKWEYVIDCAGKTEEEVFSSFRKDVRTRIKQATPRYGVKVRDLKYDELTIMKEMADEAGAAHQFRDKSLEYYQEMWESFQDKVKFVVAEVPREVATGEVERVDDIAGETVDERSDRSSGKASRKHSGKLSGEMVPIAAVMYMLYGTEVISLFSGVTRKYRNVGGCSHLVRWEMIKYAIEQGYPRYNFYGVRPETGNSVYKFKEGFRGEIHELVGTQMLPLTLLGRAATWRAKYYKYGIFG